MTRGLVKYNGKRIGTNPDLAFCKRCEKKLVIDEKIISKRCSSSAKHYCKKCAQEIHLI